MKILDTDHVADFHDLCPRLSSRESFGESRRNGIWALPTAAAAVRYTRGLLRSRNYSVRCLLCDVRTTAADIVVCENGTSQGRI